MIKSKTNLKQKVSETLRLPQKFDFHKNPKSSLLYL